MSKDFPLLVAVTTMWKIESKAWNVAAGDRLSLLSEWALSVAHLLTSVGIMKRGQLDAFVHLPETMRLRASSVM